MYISTTTLQNANYLPHRGQHNSKPEPSFCKFQCSRFAIRVEGGGEKKDWFICLCICLHTICGFPGWDKKIKIKWINKYKEESERANNFDVSHVAARWFHVLSWGWLSTSFVMLNWTRLSTTPSLSYCDMSKFILLASFSRQLFDIKRYRTGKVCVFGFLYCSQNARFTHNFTFRFISVLWSTFCITPVMSGVPAIRTRPYSCFIQQEYLNLQ